MPKVTFIDDRGARLTVEVDNGNSVMRAAIDNGVSGIVRVELKLPERQR